MGVEVVVGHRVDQQLKGERRPAPVPGPERHHRGQVAPRAVPADSERRPVLLGGPFDGCPGVFDGGREAVLGRHPVVHGDHRAAGPGGQRAAHAVVSA